MEFVRRVNYLDEWAKYSLQHFSSLMPNAILPIEFQKLAINELAAFWGNDFFVEEIVKTNAIERINNSKPHWVKYLLRQSDSKSTNIGSVLQLLEIVEVLLFTKANDNIQYKKLQSNAIDSESFQNLYFECLVLRLLSYNSIKVKSNVWDQGQALEGICTIEGIDYMYECKKIQAPVDVDVKNMLDAFHSSMKVIDKYLPKKSIIISAAADKFTPKVRIFFEKNFRDAIIKLSSSGINLPISFNEIFEEENHFEMLIEPYKEALFENIKYSKNNWLVFKHEVGFVKGGEGAYVNMEIHTSVAEKKLIEHLKTSIQKKRKQHKTRKEMNRIFFFYNGSINGTHLPLFLEKGRNSAKEGILKYLIGKQTKDIVCLIHKHTINGVYKWDIDLWNTENADKVGLNKIQKMNFGFLFDKNNYLYSMQNSMAH